MLSKRFQYIFLLSIGLFIVHGLEEYSTGFYGVDQSFRYLFHPFETMGSYQATFLVFQIMLWILLILAYLLIFKKSLLLPLLTIPVLIFIGETYHLIKIVQDGTYYPGSITALLFPVIGFFYWKELLKMYKQKSREIKLS